jgi:hypothetical protein
LRNTTTASYDWARHDDGSQATTDWANLYAESPAQVGCWPAAGWALLLKRGA